MEYIFSNKVSTLAPSVIREILKFTSTPGMISFAAGNPAPEAFPCKAVAKIIADIMQNDPINALQYSVTEGYAPLRETMKKYMNTKYNVGRDFDDLIITAGAQQVMDLATKSLCNEGDVIICEAPTFIGSLNAFRSYGAKLVGVPMQPDGMDTEILEEILKSEKNVRFIYTIPNFQNPTGITTSLKKRKEIYELAKKYNTLILEDNPYGEIRFDGEAIPSIKSFDEEGVVIYAGSFSKVLSPGLRVGYTVCPKTVLAKMICCKQTSDVHTSILSQMIANEFVTKCDFDAHLEKIRGIYRRKYGIMSELMTEHFDGKITFQQVEGGLFLWCRLPDTVDMMDFCTTAVKNNVALVPGNAFLINEKDECHYFRANYSTPTDEQLKKGVEILGELCKKL
ncbi:MAG: PLP-dependent aminotransferase family protein [Acutalibacteraceae bacterium]|nr:PLP-dependent aminotransferase family protein [Acutalibacteraceae bacterium]